MVAVAAVYAVRGLAPSPAAIEEGHAFTAVNNKMMNAMAGKGVTYSGNPDGDFAMLMIPHHQGAVDMTAVELKYGSDAAIRALAGAIAAAQQPQIEQMSRWRQEHQLAATPGAEAARRAFTAANDKLMKGMMSQGMAHSGNADLDFVQMMVPHHQGAIDMRQVELDFGQDPELRALAQDIITAQKGEIAQMTGWLRTRSR